MEHRLDWGVTPKTRKRFAVCTCGWRAPARSKLTHGISDVRDHLRDVKAECAAQGWRWSMIKVGGLVVEKPDPAAAPAEIAESSGVSLPRVSAG